MHNNKANHNGIGKWKIKHEKKKKKSDEIYIVLVSVPLIQTSRRGIKLTGKWATLTVEISGSVFTETGTNTFYFVAFSLILFLFSLFLPVYERSFFSLFSVLICGCFCVKGEKDNTRAIRKGKTKKVTSK